MTMLRRPSYAAILANGASAYDAKIPANGASAYDAEIPANDASAYDYVPFFSSKIVIKKYLFSCMSNFFMS